MRKHYNSILLVSLTMIPLHKVPFLGTAIFKSLGNTQLRVSKVV
jgi:hypothetical protein